MIHVGRYHSQLETDEICLMLYALGRLFAKTTLALSYTQVAGSYHCVKKLKDAVTDLQKPDVTVQGFWFI